MRTTDLASIDADGFITLHGRADGAINRGGFKVSRNRFGACWFRILRCATPAWSGCPTHRLGEVPFAAVETVPGIAGAGGSRAAGDWCASNCRDISAGGRYGASTSYPETRR